MTKVRIDPVEGLRGSLRPPPDKSISHRCALVATMTMDPVRVHNYLDAGDTIATLDAIRSVGAVVENRPDELVIRGTGLRAAGEADAPIDVRNAGTLMRLLPGWLAGQPGGLHWTIDGDASIRRRPVDRIAAPLRAMGGRLEATEGRYPPFTVHGSALHGVHYDLPVASAQVKSCTMLAALVANGETSIHEPHPTRDHTERLLLRAGVPVRREGSRVIVPSIDELEFDDVTVPGDLSSAAFFIAAGLLVPGSRLIVEGVGVNWTRLGFVRVLERMGAIIVGDLEPEGTPSGPEEPVSDLDIAAGPLEGTTVEPHEVPLAIDELPLIALVGCFAEGETVVRGANELRFKESDRIAGVVDGLRGLGADIEATEDGFVVRGAGGLRGGSIASRGDHRLAMLGAVAGLASQEGVEVVGMDAAAVSYPAFPDDLAALV
ncbi:MAG TPA: 3-phosphoshikimate 1-carboxyvinyltransferase [Solirubrobacteraceae bacterium]|nr:3-phosphoshikimate 1-carboxyvinyltransferase [Solirubrobacteraceae bacterium]